ncbi:hypothetical protein CJJ23_01950 [Mycoplasmopsis agassizii]|uniref:Uncharacterized protein n=1 Tax=Mycoplasmopsis agassizii TaxID=33922 RepID=A0A269TIT4_9BACT|nr:signal peptidase II [Mycoplasmopsis agassizii]PAK21392.1 hypothetical protein CJJ23_01950 [Mycoplasmopsis agassizii]
MFNFKKWAANFSGGGKAIWKRFLQWNKNHVKEHWKQILISYAVVFLFFAIFLMIDLVTKGLLFEFGSNSANGRYRGSWEAGEAQAINYSWIGIRSVFNYSVTIAGSAEINVDAIQALSLIAIIIFTTIVYFYPALKWWHYFRLLFLGVLTAGILGNAVDRFVWGAVRDMVFVPGYESRGTFNFADSFIIAGVATVLLYTILSIIFDRKDSSKTKEDQERSDYFKSQITSGSADE